MRPIEDCGYCDSNIPFFDWLRLTGSEGERHCLRCRKRYKFPIRTFIVLMFISMHALTTGLISDTGSNLMTMGLVFLLWFAGMLAFVLLYYKLKLP